MRFLVDNALSPSVAERLNQASHDAVHLRDYAMERAIDQELLCRAAAEHRHLISADTDFANLLALGQAASPSVILFRRLSLRRPSSQADLILSNLGPISGPLEKGCIVVLEETRIRVRPLPITNGP
ncbi:MAG: hypothetical protein BZY80_00865 [SAR202 cluster bacterium Io17-Chloro-G2]|nr:MAG: hypothetical protein BZY80_00865 [SAR202 cluster bacterium Io17-Chloro-G2]